MSERPSSPDARTLAQQGLASDPDNSAWVAANAGAGKTHVLTQRVLRLLLGGAAPESLLCLTYTKAAAAEMRDRVTRRLAGWAVMQEEVLASEIEALTERRPDAERLRFARTLFARALETPGGLRINTIHAFAESLLHRFPLEAGVPFGFTVIEQARQSELIEAARNGTIVEGFEGGGALGVALETLYTQLSDHSINTAISDALASFRKLAPVLRDPQGAKERLVAALGGALPGEAALRAQIVNERIAGAKECAAFLEIAPPKPGGTRRLQDRLGAIDIRNPGPEELMGAFLTQGWQVPKIQVAADLVKKAPDLTDKLFAEAERLAGLGRRIRIRRQMERTHALIDVLGAIVGRYEQDKRAQSALDFNDLIARTVDLLTRRELGAWVRYKLDQGITHILVDESQDTNPEQWAVVTALAEEFFAGEGAIDRPRSIFAVGDQKQSIYSFQGAEPGLFPAAGRDYERLAEQSGRKFVNVRLQSSFRTLENLLRAVDLTFANSERAPALLSTPDDIVHTSARTHKGGVVALWPIEEPSAPPPQTDSWPLPGEQRSDAPVEHRLAARIAATISDWLTTGRRLPARDRPVTPDDILILVQTRSALFSHIVRALKQARIPSPGADRLAVSAHIAVLDLIALGEVMLNTHDDLSLAALLRSPLFDVSEDDLFALAHNRGAASLFEALAHTDLPAGRDAYAHLRAWQRRLDQDRPYEFYAHVLFRSEGLKRFHGRLGPEVDDVISEFMDMALDQEQADQPSLMGFLSAMRAREEKIKRELSESGNGVRIMTVHGAKGLEAPIVILADAASVPSSSKLSQSVYFGQRGEGPYLSHRTTDDAEDTEANALAGDWRQSLDAEYWRQLYVAMTRAEDELHMVGFAKKQLPDKSWYAAVQSSLDAQTETRDFGPAGPVQVFPQTAPAWVWEERGEKVDTSAAPLSLGTITAPEMITPLHPSSRSMDAAPDAGLAPQADAARAVGGHITQSEQDALRPGEAARREGISLHALLQHLPNVDPKDRPQVALNALGILLPEFGERHSFLVKRVGELLADPELAFLFGPDARAEVPIIANGIENGRRFRLTGRIDRLVVSDGVARIVDFKSDMNPPARLDDVPHNYVRQLALYGLAIEAAWPDLEVKAGLVWTANGILTWLPSELVKSAVGDVLLVKKGTGTA